MARGRALAEQDLARVRRAGMAWRGAYVGASRVARSHAIAVCVALSSAPFALALGALGRADRQRRQEPQGREQPESHGQCGRAVLWTTATACLVTLGFLLTGYALSKRIRKLVPHVALTGGAAMAACSALAAESDTAPAGERLLLLMLVGFIVFFAPYVTFRANDLVLRRHAPMRVVKGLFFSLLMSCGCTLFGSACIAYVTVSSNLEGSGAFLLNGMVYPCAIILTRRALFSVLCKSYRARDTHDGVDNLAHSGVLAFGLRMLDAAPQTFVLLSSDSPLSFVFSSISGGVFELASAALYVRMVNHSVGKVGWTRLRRLQTQSSHHVVPNCVSAKQAEDPVLPGAERGPEPDHEASGAAQDGPSTSGVAQHDLSASGVAQDYPSASRNAQDGPSASSPLPSASPPLPSASPPLPSDGPQLPSQGPLLPSASIVWHIAPSLDPLVCSEPAAKADFNKLGDLITPSSKPAFQRNATTLLIEGLLDYEDCGERSGMYLGASVVVASRGLDTILLAMIATLLIFETATDEAKNRIFAAKGIHKRPLDVRAHSWIVLLGLALLAAAAVTELLVAAVVSCIFS